MAIVNNEKALAALEQIGVATSSERLRAARFLARNATDIYRDRLSKIRATEPNSWVRRALDKALERSGVNGLVTPIPDPAVPESPPPDNRVHEELRAQAIEETTALFLHELRPLVGFVEDAASREIDLYPYSETKASVSRIRLFLDAVQRLRTAAAAPAIQEFDLTDSVTRVVADEVRTGRASLDPLEHEAEQESLEDETEGRTGRRAVTLSLARRDPVITTGDPTLIEIALANVVRNAIEAVLGVPKNSQCPIVLNWDMTDTDSWVAVLDRGSGLPLGSDRLPEPGSTTKSKDDGHLGMGLPIARRAMSSMGGSIRFAPRSDSGVACEIRWPHKPVVL